MTAALNGHGRSDNNLDNMVRSACHFIQKQTLLRPSVAIVLGSGLGGLADHVEHAQSIAYCEIPGFTVTHAVGHAGKLILGYIGGVPVVLMQGRSHRYEGRSKMQIQFPIRVMQALGAETLIATNAAGGLNPRFEVGDLMTIDGHIDFLWPQHQWPIDGIGDSQPTLAQVPARSNPYCPSLIRRLKAIAVRNNIVLHQGCYLGTLGPTYETRSEYRFFRWAGADAVGMSTIHEVLIANQLGLKVLAFSVITNIASTDLAKATSHEEVVQYGNSAGPRLMILITRFLDELSGQPD